MHGSIKKLVIATAAAVMMIATTHAAPVLYGVSNTGGGGSESQLLIVDQTTGAVTNVGTGIGFGRISAIDFHPVTGLLYATGARAGDGSSVLLTIDKTTGIGTEIGVTGIESAPFISGQRNVAGMSFRNADGALFGFVEPSDQVATLNISSGAASLLGTNSVSGSGNGIAFDSGDTLYHANELDLHIVNQATGDSTIIATLDFSSLFFDADFLFPRVSGMDFHPGDGVLFASVINDDFDSFIAIIDLMTGDLTYLSGGATASKVDAIAFMPMQVSEPGMLAILGLGFAAIGFIRRRRAP